MKFSSGLGWDGRRRMQGTLNLGPRSWGQMSLYFSGELRHEFRHMGLWFLTHRMEGLAPDDTSKVSPPRNLLYSDTWQRVECQVSGIWRPLAHQMSGCHSCQEDSLNYKSSFPPRGCSLGHLHSLNLELGNVSTETFSLLYLFIWKVIIITVYAPGLCGFGFFCLNMCMSFFFFF